jgi:A/G-specific adenine glycosylase
VSLLQPDASPTTPEVPQRRALQAVGRAILEASSVNLRNFPWRQTRNPWHILIAEIALQQTQAARVAERYVDLTTHLATPDKTIEVGKAGVIALWSGLGYNSRAVRLFDAAVRIVEQFGGEVPATNAELRSLPGIGPYTAAAVETFAFERDVAVYDTNVARVIARAVLGQPTTAAQGWRIAQAMVPVGKGWIYNQSLLDFGATVCTARSPLCAECPLRRRCVWRRRGGVDPARTTAGTARPQGTFKGSTRQRRGQIIEHLRRGSASASDLLDATGLDDVDQLAKLLSALTRDGLVTKVGQRFELG